MEKSSYLPSGLGRKEGNLFPQISVVRPIVSHSAILLIYVVFPA